MLAMDNIRQPNPPLTPVPGIDPIDALATSMYASPGSYAFLLGAGMSVSAGQPSAWEILYGMIRQLIKSEGGEPPSENEQLEQWWRKRMGKELHYGDVLNELEPTPASRQARLRKYFEPASTALSPEGAHQKLAELCDQGFIKVILTTNFDPLIENTLTAKGVVNQSITPQTISGMTPIVHTKVTVIKIHGDYRSIEMKNTPEELQKYPRQLDKKLKEVLRDFGLVIVGWSGAWDEALKNLIENSQSHMYPLYFVRYKENPIDNVYNILTIRKGHTINSDGADDFFEKLSTRLNKINEVSKRKQKFPRKDAKRAPNYFIPFEDLASKGILLRVALGIGPVQKNESDIFTPSLCNKIHSTITKSNLYLSLTHMGTTGIYCDIDRPGQELVNQSDWQTTDFSDTKAEFKLFINSQYAKIISRLIVADMLSGSYRDSGPYFLCMIDVQIADLYYINGSKSALQLIPISSVAQIFYDCLKILSNDIFLDLGDILPPTGQPQSIDFYIQTSEIDNVNNKEKADLTSYIDFTNFGTSLGKSPLNINDIQAAFKLYGIPNKEEMIELVLQAISRMAANKSYLYYEKVIESIGHQLNILERH